MQKAQSEALTSPLSNLFFAAIEIYNRFELASERPEQEMERIIMCTLLPTYRKKNHDYGNSFDMSMDEYGPVVAKIRVGDKVQRFLRLTSYCEDGLPVSQMVADESVQDTLLDLCNYAIMSLMWLSARNE